MASKSRHVVVEAVPDPQLGKKQVEADTAFRRFFPGAPSLTLYRTAEGKAGFSVALDLGPGQRDKLVRAYAAVMRVLGERRGRAPGERKVQTKLRLREPVYRALEAAARRSHTTLSHVVEDLAQRARLL